MSNGKGSIRRPSSVPPAVEADNWARTFAKEQRDLVPAMHPTTPGDGISMCLFSGGPLHGTCRLVEDWVQGLGYGELRGAPYYRRDAECPTRFTYHGTITATATSR